VSREAITTYLGRCEESSKLYDNGYVVYLRASMNTTATHVRGQCRAEMKKGTAYMVDVRVAQDGHIDEAQCECAAGVGPHAVCKHVVAILFAVHDFSVNNKLNLHLTCTQKLQTFHKSKPFLASPVKASHLNICHSNTNNNNLRYDPRPADCRNAPQYSSYVRNTVINYRGLLGGSVPLAQLYEPANRYAIEHDHDYSSDTLSEIFLKEVNVTHITPSSVSKIETETRGQAANQKWHMERCLRLHASKFGAVCKCRDGHKMAENLVHHVRVMAAPISHGRLFESTAIKQFEELHGVRVQVGMGINVSLDKPYLACSPDGIIDAQTLVEVKCPYSAKNSAITPETVPYLYLDDQTGLLAVDKKHNYYYQIQGQLFVTNKTVCIFVVYSFQDMLVIKVNRDDEFIASMIEQLDFFFHNYFKAALLKKYFYKTCA